MTDNNSLVYVGMLLNSRDHADRVGAENNEAESKITTVVTKKHGTLHKKCIQPNCLYSERWALQQHGSWRCGTCDPHTCYGPAPKTARFGSSAFSTSMLLDVITPALQVDVKATTKALVALLQCVMVREKRAATSGRAHEVGRGHVPTAKTRPKESFRILVRARASYV